MIKKISKKYVIMIIAVLCVLAVVGFGVNAYYQDIGKDEKNTYMALRYLTLNNCDRASVYLEKVNKNTVERIEFAKGAAEIVEQKLLDNTTLYNIKLDIISDDFSENEKYETVIEDLGNIKDISVEAQGLIEQIIECMKISEDKKEFYDNLFNVEYEAMYVGYVSSELEGLYDKDQKNKLEITAALCRGDYLTAIQKCAERVNEDPTAENRLLLADMMATASYAGYTIDEAVFYETLGEDYDIEAANDKKQQIQEELDDIQNRINAIQEKIYAETDGSKVTELNQKITELYEQQDAIRKQEKHLLIYKAMNSISDILSAEARIVEAKLYYAVDQQEKAVDVLVKAADSIPVKLNKNEAVKQGFRLISNLHNGKAANSVAKSSVAKNVLKKMLTSANDVVVMDLNNDSINSLVTDLSGNVLAEYKYQDNSIHMSAIDDSKYPEISFSVTAREEILKEILDKKAIIKDTHYKMDYTAKMEEGLSSTICFVVDVSGSMSGQPLDNAKKALISFADTLEEGTEVALVTFDDRGNILHPVTTNIQQFINASNTLNDGGGTNISAGIQSGIEALEEAHGAKNIILMTDGQSSVDENIVNMAVGEGITIFTVGFGSVNQELLQNIAEQTGGTFTLADSSNDLGNVYESIGAILGNRVKITYTVTENVDERPRYAHLRLEKYNISEKVTYRTGLEDEKTIADDFFVCNSVVYILGNEWLNQNGHLELQLLTAETADISSIEIEGQKIIPNISDYGNGMSRVEFEMLPLADEGLYDVAFNFSDGSQYMAEDVILVYGTEDVVPVSSIRVGSIYLETQQCIRLSDGKVAFVNTYIYDSVEYEKRTLNAYTSNILVLDGFVYSEEYVMDKYYSDWGEHAQFTVDGVIELRENDAQCIISESGNNLSAVGKLAGEIDSEQCVITLR